MCHSKYWQADQDRKRQEAKSREERERRAAVIDDLRTAAEKRAARTGKDMPETSPAK